MVIKKISLKKLYGFPGVAGYNYEEFDDVFGCYDDTKILVGTYAIRKQKHGNYLINLLVHPEARGCGVGKYMCRHILKHYEHSVSFNVNVYNTEALVMYIKSGFKIIKVNPTRDTFTFGYY